ncbi:MAG TPA: sugar-binding protein [Bacteroidia bacterium]|nr:sugar-binding protein [Bacteroidia bacterium]
MKIYHVRHSASLDPQEGDLLEDFQFPWLDRPAPWTSFAAVWDGNTFAFRFDVEDDDLVLDPSSDPDEAVLGSDRVEFFFATSPDLSTPYYGAEMDPRGGVYDYRATYHRQFDPAWRFPGLSFTGELLEGGYSVEGTIPVSVLRELGCLRGSEMTAGVYRAEFSHGPEGVVQDWISWVHPEAEVPDFHVPKSFGLFRFCEP